MTYVTSSLGSTSISDVIKSQESEMKNLEFTEMVFFTYFHYKDPCFRDSQQVGTDGQNFFFVF